VVGEEVSRPGAGGGRQRAGHKDEGLAPGRRVDAVGEPEWRLRRVSSLGGGAAVAARDAGRDALQRKVELARVHVVAGGGEAAVPRWDGPRRRRPRAEARWRCGRSRRSVVCQPR
jgi:hypothetical protein